MTYFGGGFCQNPRRLTYFGGGFRPNPNRLTYFGGNFCQNPRRLTYFGGDFGQKTNRLTYFGGGFRPNPRRLTYFGGQQQRRPPTPPRQQKRTLLPGSFYQGGRIVQNQYGIDGRDSFSFTSRVCQHRRFPRLAVKPDALYLKIRTMRFSRLVSQHFSPSGPNCQKAYRRSRARRRLISLQPAS